jgi:hypothetical protein
VTKAETTWGVPVSTGMRATCVNCQRPIHSVVTSLSGGVAEYAWIHSERRSIFRTQDCRVRDLSQELL